MVLQADLARGKFPSAMCSSFQLPLQQQTTAEGIHFSGPAKLLKTQA
jgi:hypothetical protein